MTLLALLLACATNAPEVPADTSVVLPDATAEARLAEAPDVADAPAEAPARGSLYALDLPLVTQAGETHGLDVQRGHPTLFSMFYTTCPMACPLLIQDIQALEAGLAPEERAALRVVLVSLDPNNDVPTAMQTIVARHGLDARWTLGAVPEASVREVAAALGVRYRPLQNGGFAHTAVLTLVDADGAVVARSDGPQGREELVAAVKRLAAEGAAP